MAGNSASALGTDPREMTLRVAMARATLSRPSQNWCAVSPDWIISTSGFRSDSPKV